MQDLKPVLQQGVVYFADNGRAICLHCAGASAKYTGHDISGQEVLPMVGPSLDYWFETEDTLSCEAGCTTINKSARAAA
jgi:hypothetical protein